MIRKCDVKMSKDLNKFIMVDILPPLGTYLWWGFIYIILIYILHLPIIKIISDFTSLTASDLNTVNDIFTRFKLTTNIVLLFVFLYLAFRKVKKDNENSVFHANGLGYVNFSYGLLTFLGFIFGYSHINVINLPIWIQFKVYKSAFWTPEYDNLPSRDDKVSLTHGKLHGGEVANLQLVDTYPLSGKIPQKFNCYDTWVIERSNHGERSYNEDFIKKSTKAIQDISKRGYTTINIFASTNPMHNSKIVKENFRMDVRTRKISVIVYQSIGPKHVYMEAHKI